MTRRRLWNSRWGVGFSLVVLGLPLAGCGGDSGFGPEERVHFWIWHGGEPGFSSFVASGPIPVEVGEKVALYLAGAGPIWSGETVSCTDQEWTVEDTTVAGVTARGVLSGLTPGTTVVRVRANCGSYGRPVVERGVEVSESSERSGS